MPLQERDYMKTKKEERTCWYCHKPIDMIRKQDGIRYYLQCLECGITVCNGDTNKGLDLWSYYTNGK